MPSSRTSEIAKRSPGAFETYKGVAAQPVERNNIVRVDSLTDGNAYYSVVKAIADGSQTGQLMIATVDSDPLNGYVLLTRRDILPFNTSGYALGEPVYLSDTTPGALTMTATQTQVGTVVVAATDGRVEVDAALSEGAPAAVPGQVSQQGLTVDVQPAEGETYTLTIGNESSVVYTFTSNPVAATDVERDGTVAQIQAALEAAIIANQSDYVYAVDYGNPSPLYLTALEALEMAQTDGTGGDLTIYGGVSPIGQGYIAPIGLAPFHIQVQATAINVSEGFILFSLPVGWEAQSYSFTAYRSKGVGAVSLETFGCTATVSVPSPFDPLWQVAVQNAGATPFASGDVIVLWGLASKTRTL